MKEIKLFSTGLPEDAKQIRTAVFVDEQGFHEEFDETDDISIHAVLLLTGKLPVRQECLLKTAAKAIISAEWLY